MKNRISKIGNDKPGSPNVRLFEFASILLSLFVALAGSKTCCGQWELSAKDSAQVERYLQSIEADGILVEHLESAIASEKDLDSRNKLATKLLNLYATRLMAGGEPEGASSSVADWQSKTERLLGNYPDLGTPTIRMAILQSKYLSLIHISEPTRPY